MSSLEDVQNQITRKWVNSAKVARRAERESNKARLRKLPGYLPVARREKCRHCRKPLPLHVYSKGTAKYGWQGFGVFCKLSCGFWYGFHAAGGKLP